MLNMYKVVILCAVIVVCARRVSAVTAEQKASIQSMLLAVGLDCIKDHPLSLSDIRAFKDKRIPDGEDAKCFAACLFKKIGVMDDKGNLNPSTARESAKKIFKNSEEHFKNADDIVTTCSSVNKQMTADGTRGCDRAKLAFGCLTQNAARFGFDLDF